jgi:DNA uptake protein ComE-like DNA-binding protein
VACATWSPAQEEEAPAPKKPAASKAPQVLSPKDNKRLARAKADATAKARATDINHASKAELKKLPGMTDAYADAIIAHRPYKTKADLVVKKAIPLDLYQTFRKQVAVR